MLCGLAQAAYEVSVFAGAASTAGSTDGSASDARFNQPYGVAIDGSGNAYVADMGNCTIRKISAGVVSTLAGSPGVVGSANGIGSAASFSSPKGVAVDASGNVYVADTVNHTIRQVQATNAEVVNFAGSAGVSGSTDGTSASTARFNSPQGVAVDASGNVFVADTGNHTVRAIVTWYEYDPVRQEVIIQEVITVGSAGISGSEDGDLTTARFNQPKGVAVNSSGNVYVADTGNGTIRKISGATGEVTTLAGNPNAATPASVDGTGSAAQFNLPQGIAVSGSGNVFVSEVGSGRIRKVTPAGVVTTLRDAAGDALVFNKPTGLALDSSGQLYVTSDQNHTIDLVSLSAGPPVAQFNPFVWSKRIASTVNTSGEFAMGMATDSEANLYVTGWFDGTNDFGGVSLTNKSGGGQDMFVGKYNSAGELQWAQRAGGDTASQDAGRGVGVDVFGNVYVTGGFSGTADFGSISRTASLAQDFFLAKYNSAGVVQWVRRNASGGTNNSAYGTGLAVDAIGNSYAVGYYDGSGVTFGTTTLTNSGDFQCFLVKYNSAGILMWVKPLAGSGMVYAIKVALDSAGNVCLSGTFTESMTVGGTNLISVGGRDIFVVKFNNDGVLQWARQVGGTGDDVGEGGVAMDAADNVFITGAFRSSSITFGDTTLTNAGSQDAYIAKYDSFGTVLWARRAGDANLDYYGSVAVDKQGNAYAAGTSASGAIVAKYDAAGILQWTHSASSAAADPVGSIAAQCSVDASGNCYLAGIYQTATTFGTNVLQPVGYWNFFLAKLPADDFAGSYPQVVDEADDNIQDGVTIDQRSLPVAVSQTDDTHYTVNLTEGENSAAIETVRVGNRLQSLTRPTDMGGFNMLDFIMLSDGTNRVITMIGQDADPLDISFTVSSWSTYTGTVTLDDFVGIWNVDVYSDPNLSDTAEGFEQMELAFQIEQEDSEHIRVTTPYESLVLRVAGNEAFLEAPVSTDNACSHTFRICTDGQKLSFHLVNSELFDESDVSVTIGLGVKQGAVGPLVLTGAATGITETASTLNGTINPNGLATTAMFEYGLTTSYGSTVSVTLTPNDGVSTEAVSAAISGLQAGATYHYRLSATNSDGSNTGGDMTFTTVFPCIYTISDGQVTINEYTGSNADVIIPDTIEGLPVTCLDDSAFSDCTILTRITIPASVTSISGAGLIGCANLVEFSVDPLNRSYCSMDGILFSKDKSILIRYPAGKSGTHYTIPNGVTIIDNFAFHDCISLTGVTMPDTVASIYSEAFYQCTSLASITIPASVTLIEDWAFYGCSSLTSARFVGDAPEMVTFMGDSEYFDGVASGFEVCYFAGATGFTGVPWNGYSLINMGEPTPVTTWLVDNALPHDSDLKAAPKGDGVSLLMAYALNLDPNQNLSDCLPEPVLADGTLSLAYYAGNNDVKYAVETSIDLKNWTKVGVTLSAPNEDHVRQASVAMTGMQRYLRLVVEH